MSFHFGPRPKLPSFFSSHRLFVLIAILGAWLEASYAYAQAIREEDVTFHSGDVTLSGTILVPDRSAPGPAIVLVHGAGLGLREKYRSVAEAFAREDLLVLIYDKRTEGYSSGPTGGRSYALLADDAIAAVNMLQQRADVDPAQVGLWGLSEGGWVAPLAATRSNDIAFVIAVAGGGIGPVEQTAWATEGALRRHGVTSEGSLRALADHAFRFLVSAELFAEGTFDPVPVHSDLQQPVLAIWGAMDEIMPAAASARAMQEALEHGGNRQYVLQMVPDASHDVLHVVNGEITGRLAPGYVETMSAWVREVLNGTPPGPLAGELRSGEHPTRPSAKNPAGFAHWAVQLGFLAAFLLLFGGYFLVGIGQRLRRRPGRPAPASWKARLVALLGLTLPLLLFAYIAFVSATSGEMVIAVLAGRPVIFLVLQILALLLPLLAVLMGFSWYRNRHTAGNPRRTRLILLLMGVILFVPWAWWWQLYTP